MSPFGSTWPAIDDLFRIINEGTTAYTSNLPRELAEAIESIQQVLGVKPHDFSSELGLTAFSDFAAALKARCRYEIGTYIHPASTVDFYVAFANPARFFTQPLVFPIKSFGAIPDDNENYWVFNPSSAGFHSLRRVTGYTAKTSSRTMKYFAIQLP